MRFRSTIALAAALLASACGRDPAKAPPESEASSGRAAAAESARPPDLVVYLVDTLRADRLGCYGYARRTSPRLDAFARGAVRIEEARAQASWTKPAVATILTGLYPVTHGAERRNLPIAPGVVPLAERLRAAGYETAMFTTNPTVTAKFGFDRGFDTYESVHQLAGRRKRSVRSDEMNRVVAAWLDERERTGRTKPLFLVVHTLDPHDPYRPVEPFRSRFAPGVDVRSACCFRGERPGDLLRAAAERRARDASALYGAEVAANDASFGAFLDDLARRGRLESSAILFTSDHGEEFYEHGGFRHAETLYEEVLRVPFVLRLPHGAHGGTVLPGPADQIDVAPTFLAVAGVAVPEELPGGNWLPAIAHGGEAPPRESLAWLKHPAFEIAAIRDGAWKWIRREGPGRMGEPAEALYELAVDPAERDDRLAAEPERRRELARRSLAATARFRGAEGKNVEIDPELDRELRALGYL